ncbi:hypothetical protein G6O67_006669 [Ophiocordyceps sinensis]|uniref:Uncharacterized protein n=1 Tax=Ophiocordyceps sinensis TaxID=72228 RepID=A0A8H4LX93_9HYPO|nr:hypothetical protein G6O67_006669 [Ophiocordyceps sinensis]
MVEDVAPEGQVEVLHRPMLEMDGLEGGEVVNGDGHRRDWRLRGLRVNAEPEREEAETGVRAGVLPGFHDCTTEERACWTGCCIRTPFEGSTCVAASGTDTGAETAISFKKLDVWGPNVCQLAGSSLLSAALDSPEPRTP